MNYPNNRKPVYGRPDELEALAMTLAKHGSVIDDRHPNSNEVRRIVIQLDNRLWRFWIDRRPNALSTLKVQTIRATRFDNVYVT